MHTPQSSCPNSPVRTTFLDTSCYAPVKKQKTGKNAAADELFTVIGPILKSESSEKATSLSSDSFIKGSLSVNSSSSEVPVGNAPVTNIARNTLKSQNNLFSDESPTKQLTAQFPNFSVNTPSKHDANSAQTSNKQLSTPVIMEKFTEMCKNGVKLPKFVSPGSEEILKGSERALKRKASDIGVPVADVALATIDETIKQVPKGQPLINIAGISGKRFTCIVNACIKAIPETDTPKKREAAGYQAVNIRHIINQGSCGAGFHVCENTDPRWNTMSNIGMSVFNIAIGSWTTKSGTKTSTFFDPHLPQKTTLQHIQRVPVLIQYSPTNPARVLRYCTAGQVPFYCESRKDPNNDAVAHTIYPIYWYTDLSRASPGEHLPFTKECHLGGKPSPASTILADDLVSITGGLLPKNPSDALHPDIRYINKTKQTAVIDVSSYVGIGALVLVETAPLPADQYHFLKHAFENARTLN